MTNKTFSLFLIIVITTGCSTTANKAMRIGYDSNPRGASIVCNGQNMGYTPHILAFTPTEEQVKSDTATIPPCQIKWVSGATVNVKATVINDLKVSFQKGRSGLFQRPNVPGYEKDVNFSLKVATLRAQQAQTLAARQQASAAQSQANSAYQANIIQRNAIQQQRQQNYYNNFNKNIQQFQRNNNYNMSTWSNVGSTTWKPLKY